MDKEARGQKRNREAPKAEEQPPRAFEPQVMVRGCIVDIAGIPKGVRYQAVKDQLGSFGRVRFMEFLKKNQVEGPPQKRQKQEANDAEGVADEEDDFNEEEEEEEEETLTARARFFEPEDAKAAAESLKEVSDTPVTVSLLSGADEEAFWENVNRKLKEAFENPKGKGGKKGKGKGKESKGKGKSRGAKGKGGAKGSE